MSCKVGFRYSRWKTCPSVKPREQEVPKWGQGGESACSLPKDGIPVLLWCWGRVLVLAEMRVPSTQVDTGSLCSLGPDGEGRAGPCSKRERSCFPRHLPGGFSEGGQRPSCRLPGNEGSSRGGHSHGGNRWGQQHGRPVGLSCGLGLSWRDGHMCTLSPVARPSETSCRGTNNSPIPKHSPSYQTAAPRFQIQAGVRTALCHAFGPIADLRMRPTDFRR